MQRTLATLIQTVTILALTNVVLAVPNITVKPLGSDCVAYPSYDEATGIAEPLHMEVVSSVRQELDGYQFIPKFAIAVGGGSWGFVRSFFSFFSFLPLNHVFLHHT